jgi:hypothetical protein
MHLVNGYTHTSFTASRLIWLCFLRSQVVVGCYGKDQLFADRAKCYRNPARRL